MSEIVSTDDTLGGAPRIEGRRIGVHHIVGRVIDGVDETLRVSFAHQNPPGSEDDVAPAQVAADYDLAIADVYRALTYYYDHPDEISVVRKQRTTPPDGMRVVRGPEDFDHRETPEREA